MQHVLSAMELPVENGLRWFANLVKKHARDTQRVHGAQGGYLAGKVVEVLGEGEGAGQHLPRARVVPRLQRQRSEAAEHLLWQGIRSADSHADQHARNRPPERASRLRLAGPSRDMYHATS